MRHLDWRGQKKACTEKERCAVVEMVLYIRLDACHELFYLSLPCLLTSGLISLQGSFREGLFNYLLIRQSMQSCF